MFKKLSIILFFLSLPLFGLNILGSVISLRDKDIYKENAIVKPLKIYLTEQEFLEKYETTFNSFTSDSMKVVFLTDLVNRGMLHCWSVNKKEKYNIKLPVFENYILYTLGMLYPKRFGMYEFSNWRRGIERGVGLCSQHAIIETDILKENNIESYVVGLDGHVVITAKIRENKWIIADPNFGVVIPFNLREVESNPSIVNSYYSSIGNETIVGYIIDYIANTYGVEGNITFNIVPFRSKELEDRAYLWIWLLPTIMSFPLVISKTIF